MKPTFRPEIDRFRAIVVDDPNYHNPKNFKYV